MSLDQTCVRCGIRLVITTASTAATVCVKCSKLDVPPVTVIQASVGMTKGEINLNVAVEPGAITALKPHERDALVFQVAAMVAAMSGSPDLTNTVDTTTAPAIRAGLDVLAAATNYAEHCLKRRLTDPSKN